MSILSQDLFDPLKADLDPALADLTNAIEAAMDSFLSRTSTTASLAPLANLVLSVGAAAATTAINNKAGIKTA